MALKKIDDANLKAIANKLREVTEDESQRYTVDTMPTAIRSLIRGPGTCNFGWNNQSDPTQITLNISDWWANGYNVSCMYRFSPGSSITINWGDGSSNGTVNYSSTVYGTVEFLHTYSSGGSYTISVTKKGTCEMYQGFGLTKK